MGLVVAEHRRRVGLPVADVGNADLGRLVDHVVVGKDQAVRGEHDTCAGPRDILVVEVHVDIDEIGGDLGGDGRDV